MPAGAPMLAAAASSTAPRRPTMYTRLAPASASALEIMYLMPVPPPVTSAAMPLTGEERLDVDGRHGCGVRGRSEVEVFC